MLAPGASAQDLPPPLSMAPPPMLGNARVRAIAYRETEVVPLMIAPGYQLGIEFAPNEEIETVALGDSGAWSVTPNKQGNRLFVKPVGDGAATNMTVVTGTRTYLFDLEALPVPSSAMVYTIRFIYPDASATSPTVQTAAESSDFRVRGDKALRPSRMSDDGFTTTIEWPRLATLPAIYAVDEAGRESLVNGAMEDGRYVIDGVADRYKFRIDNRSARATREKKRVRE